MSVSYNKLWKLLIDRKMSVADLRRATKLAPNTITSVCCKIEMQKVANQKYRKLHLHFAGYCKPGLQWKSCGSHMEFSELR